jgi:hypothetical protein
LGSATVASSLADAHGAVELVFVARRSGTLTIGTAGGDVPVSRARLRVAPRLRISVSDASPRRGQVVMVRGRIAPGLRGRRVTLLARIDDSWYPVKRRVRVGRKGHFKAPVTSAVRGTIAVRVHMSAKGSWAAANSNTRVLTVS